MRCPNCGLENPPSAASCDCGYNFETNTGYGPYKKGLDAGQKIIVVLNIIAALTGIFLLWRWLLGPFKPAWIP